MVGSVTDMHRVPGTCVGIGTLKNARHLPVPGILKFFESPQNYGRQLLGATGQGFVAQICAHLTYAWL